MLTVDEVSSTVGLEALRGVWEDLQAGSTPHNVFLTFDWARAWWLHLGAGRRLRVLVLRDSGRVCGIVPLFEGPVWRSWTPFRKIQILGTGLSDRLDFLLPGDAIDSVERAFSHLIEPTVSWDLLDLREIPEQSPTIEAVRAACARLGLRCEISPDSESPYLPIDSDWETFFATRFGRERRQQMRRKARRLEANAHPIFTIIDSIPEGSTTLERLMAVNQHDTYRGERRNSIFASEAKRAFFADIAARFSRRGWLHVGVLDLGGEPAAFRFSFQYAGTYYDYYHGFDRSFAAMSPGQALLSHMMQDCFQRGLREVDFLRGTEPWKAVWTERRRCNARVRVFRPGIRSSALRLLLSVNDRHQARSRGRATGQEGVNR